ncbi:hypothetical protein psal_cds_19 [Pandoravirus salinus]|uniref:Uncharacterized protein n=1 Tax=Pandoravirus salinus TaxID=1349410 RepID=A0A291ATE9_9VIRU|nr:hypothetical protein psal_cds_19 [Pandoravirus salinus]ATE82104.1 hypothetical protein psal_cds_19 [Pandoravirus salinus]
MYHVRARNYDHDDKDGKDIDKIDAVMSTREVLAWMLDSDMSFVFDYGHYSHFLLERKTTRSLMSAAWPFSQTHVAYLMSTMTTTTASCTMPTEVRHPTSRISSSMLTTGAWARGNGLVVWRHGARVIRAKRMTWWATKASSARSSTSCGPAKESLWPKSNKKSQNIKNTKGPIKRKNTVYWST